MSLSSMQWPDPLNPFKAGHRAQLLATSVLSGIVVAISILSFQSEKKNKSLAPSKNSQHAAEQNLDDDRIRKSDSPGISVDKHDVTFSKEDKIGARFAVQARKGNYDDDLILEQLARNRVFLTDDGLDKLRHSFVIVVGCGGVGSHVTAALARSGVSKLRLIDFDQVSLSSLNRHAVATLADVGTSKVFCLRRRLEQIAPWINFDCRNELFSKVVAEVQLEPWDGRAPDYVVDAIDNIDSKVDLLKYCHDHALPVISSMGAGCKSDPTRVFISDIATSTDDPLSKSTRRRLRLNGISSGIPVVFSTEKPGPGKAKLLPLPEDEFQKGKVGELGILPDFRIRILPVLGTMPAVFGMCIANHVMLELTGYPHEYVAFKSRDKLYDAILAALQGLEERLARANGHDTLGLRLPLTPSDVGYLLEEVYKGKSVVSGLPTRLALVRWRRGEDKAIVSHTPGQKSVRLRLNELVCMTKEEVLRHEKEVLIGGKAPEDLYDDRTIAMVKARMDEEEIYSTYRQ